MKKALEMNIGIAAVMGGSVLSNLSKLAKGMDQISKEAEKTSKITKQLDETNKELANNRKLLEKLDNERRKLNDIGNQYRMAKKQLDVLKKSYRDVGESKNDFAKKVKDAENKVASLNRRKEEQQEKFKKAKSAIEEEGLSLKYYSDSLVKTNKALEKNKILQEKYKKQMEKYDKYNDKLSNVNRAGVRTLGALATPIKIYMDVENSQADLRKILDKEAELYYDKLREISDKSPLSQAEVFEIAGAAAQAGIEGKEIVKYTEQANKLKVAFDITTEEAGNFLAKTKEQLGLTTKEVFTFSDTINYMADNTASSASQLIDFSQRIGSAAKTANLSKEANLAFGATLISMGTQTEVAATGIKQLYLELGKGADTKKKMNAFKFLGINGEKLSEEMAKDAEGTILKVLDKINKINPADKIGLLTDIFGEQAVNSISTLANNTDKLRENLAKVKNETKINGSVDKEYENRLATISNKLLIAKNKFNNALSDVGKSLAPVLTNLLEKITPLLDKIAKWIQNNPKLTQGIVVLVASLASLAVVLSPIGMLIIKILKFKAGITAAGGFNKAFPKLAKSIKGFGEVIKTVTSLAVKGFFGIIKIIKDVGLAIKVAFASNPVGVIIVAIIAVIVILVLLYKKCTWFRNFVNNMWKSIVKFAVSTWEKIKSTAIAVFNFLKPFISIVINNIISYFKMLATVVKGIWSIITDYIKTYIAVWKGIFNLFIAFFTGQWNKIPGIVNGIWESIKSGIRGFVDSAKSILSGLFSWFGNQWNNIKNTASSIVDKVNIFKMGKNYTGTNYWSGGLTQVAERGAELINIPGMSSFIANTPSVLNLPKGTQILNNSQTRNTLRDRISGLRNKASNLVNKAGSVIGGDNINITINAGNNSNPLDIARIVERVLIERDNKKRRVAF